MPQEVTAYLRNAKGLTDDQRADLWDAYYSTDNPGSLAEALRGMEAPQSVKADLWDLKASGAGTEAAPPTERPASPDEDLIGRGLGAVSEWGGMVPGVGPTIAGGAAALQALRRSETPTAAAAEFVRAGTAPGIAGAAMTVPGLGTGVLGRLPGMVGTGMRTALNPKVAAPVVGGIQLARGKGPLDAGLSALETYGVLHGGRAGGAQVAERAGMSRLARLLRLGPKAERAAAPAAAARGAAGEVAAVEGATLGVRPPAGGGASRAARGMQALGEASEGGAARQIQQMVKPKVVGGASSAGGGTVVEAPRGGMAGVRDQMRHIPPGQWPPPPKLDPASVEEFVRAHQGSHSRQWITKALRGAGITERGAAKKMVDMILDAPVPSPANEAALLRVSSKLSNPPPALKEAAQMVLGKPGASVASLADDVVAKYGMTREKAVEFVETILRLAEGS